MNVGSSLSEFSKAINQHRSISFHPKEGWRANGRARNIVCALSPFHDSRILNVGREYSKFLDFLEKNPEKAAFSKDRVEEIANLAWKVTKGLQSKDSSKASFVAHAVARRSLALQYRMGKERGGWDREMVEAAPVRTTKGRYQRDAQFTTKMKNQHYPNFKRLETAVSSYRKKHPLFAQKELSKNDLRKIAIATSYPAFCDLLFQDKRLMDEFIKWAFRADNQVEAFVEFPATCKRLKQCLLYGRISRYTTNHFHRFGEGLLQIEKERGEKRLTLPFEGKRVSVLDEKAKVTFSGGRVEAIGTIFEAFRNKNADVSDFELFAAKGVCNWHTHELASRDLNNGNYARIDLTQDKWWEQFPEGEILTKEEVKKYFEISSLEKGKWVVAAMASRESTWLDIDKSHGFLKLAIPKANGEYEIYDFGKFAERFPQTAKEMLSIIGNTVPGKIESPDSNNAYSHRQMGGVPFVLSEDEGKKLMARVAKDLQKARDGNIVFQLAWENCAYWPQDVLREVLGKQRVGNIYELPISKVQTAGFVGVLVSWFSSAPKSWQPYLWRILEFLLGSWRGVSVKENGKKVFKSTRTSPFHKHQRIIVPSSIHKRIESGELRGFLHMGHCS